MSKRLLFVPLLMMLSMSANAFTDGSGWQIVSQLATLLETANEQLAKAKEMLDVKKKLEEMETVKTIRGTSDLGDDLGDLFNEMDKTIEHFDYDPRSSVSDVKSDVDRLIRRYEIASDSDDKIDMLRGYSNLLGSIENLAYLRKHHSEQIKKMSENGINEQEAIKQEALTSSLATQILIERELAAKQQTLDENQHATEDLIYLRRMGGVYEAIGNGYTSKGQ